jgi:acyl carrier protein
MIDRKVVEKIIIGALHNLNEERSPDNQIIVSLETELFGGDSSLDSLSLVSIVVDIESDIADLSGAEISLTDERAMSQPISPFNNVNTLMDYIILLLSENGHGN